MGEELTLAPGAFTSGILTVQPPKLSVTVALDDVVAIVTKDRTVGGQYFTTRVERELAIVLLENAIRLMREPAADEATC